MAIERPLECFIFDSSDLTKISSNILNILLTTDGYEGTGVVPIKYYISPSDEIYDAEKITEITNIIGTQTAAWTEESDDYANAIIGYDKNNNIISVQCLPWDIPGRLRKRLNSIQIMICENNNDSDHTYAKTAINKSVKLICYILQQLSVSTSDFNLEVTDVFEKYYNKAFKISEADENKKSTNEILSNLKEELDNIPEAENIQTKATVENISLASIVTTLIDSIGNVTLEKEYDIKWARLKYDILTDNQKSFVSNYNILESAESSFVIALINNIGDVTQGKEDIIKKARRAYNLLNSTQQSSVSNYSILEKAEAVLYNLTDAIDKTSTVSNVKKFYVNKQLITIKKNNKDIVKQGYTKIMDNHNQISFSGFIPLVQKTFMKLTGTGINFYNQLLLPQETLEYLTSNNSIPQWNILEENLLSSLSFQDINNLKMNLWQTQSSNTIQVNQQTNMGITDNYLIYPTKSMNISQTYLGEYSHYQHNIGADYIDYPIDECCYEDREYFYCPCNEMEIKEIYGVNNSGTNTIWLESTSEVTGPFGNDYVTILVIHPEDDDLNQLSVDQVFTRGEPMFREGKDGDATGYHFHISVGTGKYYGNGWIKNNNKKWVLTTTGKTIKPEEAFYIDESFTTNIINTGGLKFKTLKEATSEDD